MAAGQPVAQLLGVRCRHPVIVARCS
jgi:hypothetical protein